MRFVTPLVSELLNFVRVSRGNRLQNRSIFEIKELADTEVRIRMRSRHKAIADQADTEFLHANEEEFEELQELRSLKIGTLSPFTFHFSPSPFIPPNRELLARKPSSAG